MKKTILVLMIALISLAGCAAPGPVETATATPTVGMPEPKLDANTAAIKGTILDAATGRPITKDITVYLADLLPMKEREDVFVPALDAVKAPRAESDETGSFLIVAKPGKYGLTLLAPLGPILLKDTATNKDMIVTLTANQTLDLGKVKVQVPSVIVQQP